MSLKDQMAADMVTILNEEEFGEHIRYLEPGREPKELIAIIDRQPKEALDLGGPGTGHIRTRLHLTIAKHSVQGMPTIRKGQDKVEVLHHEGDVEPTTFIVSSILDQDSASWKLELTK
jgi:hypothetical protein